MYSTDRFSCAILPLLTLHIYLFTLQCCSTLPPSVAERKTMFITGLLNFVVDSSASQSARTSRLWNEERNQCATKVFLLSVSSESEKYWRIWLKPSLVIFLSISYTQCLRYLKCICFFWNIPLVPLTGPWTNREKENIVIMTNAAGRETKQAAAAAYKELTFCYTVAPRKWKSYYGFSWIKAQISFSQQRVFTCVCLLVVAQF